VKRLAFAWLFLAALAGAVLGLARLLAPGWFELELDIFILVVVPEIAAALEREAEPPQRPPQLERIERELTMASSTAFDLHARLRPQLREIAELRLATRGVRLEDAEGVLDEEVWELVRPDRPPPSNRHAGGIPPAELRRVVEALEAL
jgi:hypothetical protein